IANSNFINNATGWENAYSRSFLLTNDQFIGGDPQKLGQFFYDDGIVGNIETANLVFNNVTINGYANGYLMPSHGDNEIHGGFINGITKVSVPAAYGGKLIIDGVTWGTTPGQAPYDILLSNDYSLNGIKSVPGYLQPMVFTYNGQTVYYNSQAANFVPFSNLSPSLNGKTNQQLWDQYGLAIGGRIAPSNGTQISAIAGGFIGSSVASPPAIET